MVSSRGRSSYRRGNIFIGPFNYNKRESQPTRRVHNFTSGLSFVSFNLTLAEHLGRRISAQCACVIKASAQERQSVSASERSRHKAYIRGIHWNHCSHEGCEVIWLLDWLRSKKYRSRLVSFLLRIHCYLTDIRNYRNVAFLPGKDQAS